MQLLVLPCSLNSISNGRSDTSVPPLIPVFPCPKQDRINKLTQMGMAVLMLMVLSLWPPQFSLTCHSIPSISLPIYCVAIYHISRGTLHISVRARETEAQARQAADAGAVPLCPGCHGCRVSADAPPP